MINIFQYVNIQFTHIK